MRILFIGNSLTYYNQSVNDDFAHIFRSQAKADVEKNFHDSTLCVVDECTMGGASLRKLWRKSKAKKMIKNNSYDYVVLQEDLPESTGAYFQEYAALFIVLCRQHHSKPILFMAWAYDRIPGCTNRMIQKAHRELAASRQCDVAPVMLARLECESMSKSITMFDQDCEHPSPEATYLSALVIYITVTGCRTFTNKTYLCAGMDKAVGYMLQHVATSVCKSIWLFEVPTVLTPTAAEKDELLTGECKEEEKTCTHTDTTAPTPLPPLPAAPLRAAPTRPAAATIAPTTPPTTPPTPPPAAAPPAPIMIADLIKHFALFANAEELTALCVVCKEWSCVILHPNHDSTLWGSLYKKDFPKEWQDEHQIYEMKLGAGRRSNSISARLRRFRKAYLKEQEHSALHEISLSMCGC